MQLSNLINSNYYKTFEQNPPQDTIKTLDLKANHTQTLSLVDKQTNQEFFLSRTLEIEINIAVATKKQADTEIEKSEKSEKNPIGYYTHDDNSPEATAQRIVSLSTGGFARFMGANPDLDKQAALQAFMEEIKNGIEQGFKESRDILDNLEYLEGDIASNINKTYDLVQNGLEEFINLFK